MMVACREMTCGERASSSATLSVARSCLDRCGCLEIGAAVEELLLAIGHELAATSVRS